MPYISTIYPNRITIRYQSEKNNDWRNRWEQSKVKEYTRDQLKTLGRNISLENLKKCKDTWKLSRQSITKIRDSIQILHQLAPTRTIKRNSVVIIKKFKTSFITLTMPQSQTCTDIEMKAALNLFLSNLRQSCQLENYVWKAELQQNGNIHFHLVIDKYVHHMAIRYYWNKALDSIGQLQDYTTKFQSMSLANYTAHRLALSASYQSSPPTQEQIKKAYEFGVKTDWKSPGTEQVVKVKDKSQLASYLAKYISKSEKNFSKNPISAEANKQRIADFGRTWGRSHSLSQFRITTRWDWGHLRKILKTFPRIKSTFHIKKYEWVTIMYMIFKKASKEIKEFVNEVWRGMAVSNGYPIPT